MRSIFILSIFMISTVVGNLSAKAEQIAASGMGEAADMEDAPASLPTQAEIEAQRQAHAQAMAQAEYEISGLLCTERINLFSRIVRDNGPMTIAIPFLRNFKHRERVYQGEEMILWMPTSKAGSAFEKKISLRCFGTSGRTEDFKPFAKIDCVDAKKEYIVGIHTVGRVFVKVAVGLNKIKGGKTTYFSCRRAQEF